MLLLWWPQKPEPWLLGLVEASDMSLPDCCHLPGSPRRREQGVTVFLKSIPRDAPSAPRLLPIGPLGGEQGQLLRSSLRLPGPIWRTPQTPWSLLALGSPYSSLALALGKMWCLLWPRCPVACLLGRAAPGQHVLGSSLLSKLSVNSAGCRAQGVGVVFVFVLCGVE